MKSTNIILITLSALAITALYTVLAQETPNPAPVRAPQTSEYASVRFMEEKTSIVWPDGTVENVLGMVPKRQFEQRENFPKGSDYRMYWLTMAMNLMAQRGFELAHMDGHDVVMKRPVAR